MGVLEPRPTAECWSAEQRRVIEAGRYERLLVEAGPGTGKTAVACARLAHLIREEDVEPSNTWMISFTRTAVTEIRARLHSYVGDAAFAIKIATIDSHAWSIHSGHDPQARLSGAYEENIQRVIELLKSDDDVTEELETVEHVVIDEAQDIVGIRADLISRMLDRLSKDCGVTVFADEAQAIYGFSDDSSIGTRRNPVNDHRSLLQRLREQDWNTVTLNQVYRTSSENLRRIFSDVRKNVLNTTKIKYGIHSDIARQIKDLSGKSTIKGSRIDWGTLSADNLILFRTRAEVLKASQFCRFPHRLRLSGYGNSLPAWLALCFHDYHAPFLSERDFFDLWSTRIEHLAISQHGPEDAWRLLWKVAGSGLGNVEVGRLRKVLGRLRPPVELTEPDYGLPGPTVGTIHASKGREAPHVALLLPRNVRFGDVSEEAEEARVLFVGATRAKSSLVVGEGVASGSAALSSGRAYGWTRTGKTEIEIGREGDITARGLVSREVLSLSEAVAAQQFLAGTCGVVETFKLQSDPKLDWRYRILTENEICVGTVSHRLVQDLWEILRTRKWDRSHRPPSRLVYVRSQGCRTIVLPPNDPELETLHEPWSSSGFVLAPRIVAFPSFRFIERS